MQLERRLIGRLKTANIRFTDAQVERIWAIVSAHQAGLSIRKIAGATGRSWGFGNIGTESPVKPRQRLLRRCTSYSWSAIGLRNGRSSPRATVSGIANEYRPNMLMWSWISGESLATSAS